MSRKLFAEAFLNERLEKRKQNGLLRKLSQTKDLIDFSSNDYLGLARSKELGQGLQKAVLLYPDAILGSTGSRLLSGNSEFAEKLEQDIAAYHGMEAALLFNSGYTANLALFSSLAQRGDTIIMDELIHASVIDGSRMGLGKRLKFKHNNLESLEEKLKVATGICYVAVESLYSMDGDQAPLKAIQHLCSTYNALLIVDEAHAFGVFEKGLVAQNGLSNQIFATLFTFGKALGAHGAAVTGSQLLRNYLINFARPFIYSTAMPFAQLLHIRLAYKYLQDHEELPLLLKKKIRLFQKQLLPITHIQTMEGPIQSILIPGQVAVRKASLELEAMNIKVYPIVSPTVAPGTERLRICLHTYNTDQEIEQLCHFLQHTIHI
ncbi:8-amino-7-oxononanoate synthase [Pedobacter sp. HMWF019]|uniref:aminotransferase class I/II-fold pyridoxal phosphate-dependent enzyme n=1 Tax=Pedobacter sp. HMWF019 TaxID=2056856 RepID=UPI000D3C5A9E|nr:8-amino-7-oxononanoate synthase [Pedobacter sp. HMWF019]PTT01534.1 8-amino-7-oxononanoate synthase [Pedobacter sp. HMWF019]